MRCSARVRCVLPSATLAMTARAAALKAEGKNILALSAGEPDFDTPQHIKDAARAAIDRGETKYTPVAGTPALRKAVTNWAHKLYGHSYKPNEVIVGTGGKQVLFNAICALLDPGDEALFASPYWVSYPDMIRFAGGKPIAVGAKRNSAALPLAEDWERAITPKTRVIILNSPSNPTGACYSQGELREIAAMLLRHPQVAIITDDIYAGLVYDAPFAGIAQLAPELRERTLIVNGVSKTYSMTGWRIGFGIGPPALIGPMTDLQGAATSGTCSIAQAAAVAALEGDQAPIAQMATAFKQRRDRIVAGLNKISDLDITAPAGAFYVFAGIGKLIPRKVASGDALCEHLLEHEGLALVPGSAFGADAYVRLSFACSEATIDDALVRLQRGIHSLR